MGREDNGPINDVVGEDLIEVELSGDDEEEDISSQPVVPYVGMLFDSLDEAYKTYNRYAEKVGFGIHRTSSRGSKVTNERIRQGFECVHARKPREGEGGSVNNSQSSSATNNSNNSKKAYSHSKSVVPEVLTIGSRKRDKVIRCNCKARMDVGLRDGKWEVVVFHQEHTHVMVKNKSVSRMYRSHRRISRADYDLLVTMHNRNISTSQMMSIFGEVHGGVRTLDFTSKDISNARSKLRLNMRFSDLGATLDYFTRLQAESPGFFHATKRDQDGTFQGLFWVDGRTRMLYEKFGDCVFFDTTFCTNRYISLV